MSFCEYCESEPCLWIEQKESVLYAVDEFKKDHASNGKQCPNNVCRKFCYRQFSLILHGHLGKGQRVQLPSCVEDGVRSQFPNESGQKYMGFKNVNQDGSSFDPSINSKK